MPKLAITGKGGVGKTTLAALLAYLYASEGRKVLAIDADPDSNLASALGISPEVERTITPIVEMEELIAERTGTTPGTFGGIFRMNPRVDDIPERFSVTHRGIRLLVMGTVDHGGSGCVCPESVMLKTLVTYLLLGQSDVLIMDMEAGIEHLGRGTAQAVDALIVVVEPGQRSIQTAHTIRRLAADIGLKKVYIVGNKVRNEQDRTFIAEQLADEVILGFLPYSAAAVEADVKGKAIFDTDPRMVEAAKVVKARLEQS
jgi:CO dehydrogenase maturation factor